MGSYASISLFLELLLLNFCIVKMYEQSLNDFLLYKLLIITKIN